MSIKLHRYIAAALLLTALATVPGCNGRRKIIEQPPVKEITVKEKPPVKNDGAKDESTAGYSEKLGIPVSGDYNKKLLEELVTWLNVPYQYGGNSKSGTDCSGFVGNIYKNVYGISVPRSSNDIFLKAEKVERGKLKSGDLVFFKINSSKVSHVGIYIVGEYFIHASTKKGVIVSNLTEPYYSGYYFSSGRIQGNP